MLSDYEFPLHMDQMLPHLLFNIQQDVEALSPLDIFITGRLWRSVQWSLCRKVWSSVMASGVAFCFSFQLPDRNHCLTSDSLSILPAPVEGRVSRRFEAIWLETIVKNRTVWRISTFQPVPMTKHRNTHHILQIISELWGPVTVVFMMFLTHITWCTHGLCTGWMWLCTISIVFQKAITILRSTVLHMLNKDLLFVSTFRLLSKSSCPKKKVLVVKIKNCVPLLFVMHLWFLTHVYQLHPGIMVSWKMNWLSQKSSTSNLSPQLKTTSPTICFI